MPLTGVCLNDKDIAPELRVDDQKAWSFDHAVRAVAKHQAPPACGASLPSAMPDFASPTRQLTIQDVLQFRTRLSVTATEYRTPHWQKLLQSQVNLANQSGPLHEKAAQLASNILDHDVFRDGNGRTALGAIYLLYEAKGKALSVMPHQLYAYIAANENTPDEYEANHKLLADGLKRYTRDKNDPDAIRVDWALAETSRLQQIKNNWADFTTNPDMTRHEWRKIHPNIADQADLRRLNHVVDICKDIGKRPDFVRKRTFEGDTFPKLEQ